jgi:methyl-accepting chemotaxis protein
MLDNETIMLAFVAVTGLAVVMQTIILLAIYLNVRKAAKSIKEEAEDLRSSLMPVIFNTRDFCMRLAPKIESATTDLAELTHGLRVQSVEMQISAQEIMERLHRLSSRVDTMFTGALDAVDRAGNFVAEAVDRPVRQFSGMLAGVKAVIESLRATSREQGASASGTSRAAADKDMFV